MVVMWHHSELDIIQLVKTGRQIKQFVPGGDQLTDLSITTDRQRQVIWSNNLLSFGTELVYLTIKQNEDNKGSLIKHDLTMNSVINI